MQRFIYTVALGLSLIFTIQAHNDGDINWTEGFEMGDPSINSISALSFGPENILFVGDAASAQVVAIDLTGQSEVQESNIKLERVDQIIAFKMGAKPNQIKITDLAVHPQTKQIFISVQHANGSPLLLKVVGENFEAVNLKEVKHAKANLVDAIAEDAKDRRGRSQRRWAISDMSYQDGKLFLTGLSNQEFGSTFRALAFPFQEEQSYSSLEIYHAAHGKYETHSPVKTFMPIQLNGEAHIIASYTCTPLVVFPMSTLKQGEHAKGRTIAELGNWNTPLDIIELENDGKRFVLLANSSRALMKLKVNDIESFGDSLTERVAERSGTAGVDFIALPFVNVLQLAKLTDDSFVMLQRKADGNLVLQTAGKRWL